MHGSGSVAGGAHIDADGLGLGLGIWFVEGHVGERWAVGRREGVLL